MAVDVEPKQERAERWRRAKPVLTVGYAAGVPAMFASRRIMRVRNRPAFAALLAAQVRRLVARRPPRQLDQRPHAPA
jgi:hypothetical protein